jgi:hypothetical protein
MSNVLALHNPVAAAPIFEPLVASVLLENRHFRADVRERRADPTDWQLQAWQLAGLSLGVLFAVAVAYGGVYEGVTYRDGKIVDVLMGEELG